MNLTLALFSAAAAALPAACLHWLRPMRGEFFFSVRVRPGFGDSGEARAITRDFRLAIWAGAAASAVVLYLALVNRDLASLAGASLVQAAALILPFWWTYSRARAHAAPPGGTLRTAALDAGDDTPPPLWVSAATPLALVILAAAAALVIALWHQLPDPMPVHFNMSGQPDRWGPKRVGNVLGILPTAIATQLLLGFVLYAITASGRPSPRRRLNQRSLAAISLAAACTMAYFSVLPLVRHLLPDARLFWLVPLLIVVASITAAVRLNQGDVTGDEPTRDDCWTALFYSDPEDARMMVPNRVNAGYAPNMGHPRTRIVFPALVALVMLSALAPVFLRDL